MSVWLLTEDKSNLLFCKAAVSRVLIFADSFGLTETFKYFTIQASNYFDRRLITFSLLSLRLPNLLRYPKYKELRLPIRVDLFVAYP